MLGLMTRNQLFRRQRPRPQKTLALFDPDGSQKGRLLRRFAALCDQVDVEHGSEHSECSDQAFR